MNLITASVLLSIAQMQPLLDRVVLLAVSREYGLRPAQQELLLAIYKAEHGAPGRELGVLVPKAQRYKGEHLRSLYLQAQWCAGTIKKRYRGDLEEFARIYCPIGADNDPKGLNKNWLKNVRFFLKGE